MKYHDRGVSKERFKKGEIVLLHNTRKVSRKGGKLEKKWLGPYQISNVKVQKNGVCVYNLNGLRGAVNEGRLKNTDPLMTNAQRSQVMTPSCITKKNPKAPVKIRQKMKKTKVFELLYHRMMKNPLLSKPALILRKRSENPQKNLRMSQMVMRTR